MATAIPVTVTVAVTPWVASAAATADGEANIFWVAATCSAEAAVTRTATVADTTGGPAVTVPLAPATVPICASDAGAVRLLTLACAPDAEAPKPETESVAVESASSRRRRDATVRFAEAPAGSCVRAADNSAAAAGAPGAKAAAETPRSVSGSATRKSVTVTVTLAAGTLVPAAMAATMESVEKVARSMPSSCSDAVTVAKGEAVAGAAGVAATLGDGGGGGLGEGTSAGLRT